MSDFQRLIDAWLDGSIDESEFEALHAQIRANDAQMRQFAEQVQLHSLLRQIELSSPEDDGFGVSRGAAESRHPGVGQTARNVFAWLPRRNVPGPVVAFSLTAVLLLAAWGVWRFTSPKTRVGDVVAWIETGPSHRKLREGERIRHSGGPTVVRFGNGARLSLSGEVDFEVLSAMKVRLNSGQLQADVGEYGKGFTVLTEATDVVDLGTVFGVGVEPEVATDVVVFDGEVELAPERMAHTEPAPARQSVVMGEAVRIQANGEQSRISAIWHDPNDYRWATSSAGTSVIAAVADNRTSGSRPKFYAIVPGGFREDARAYVDREYEWNGIDASGLPPFLVGGDYIRTFNDDKAETDLEIVVTLTGPADVYVLIDKRHPIPSWLAKDFSDTRCDLALDQGREVGRGDERVPPPGRPGIRWRGVGPGQLVDVRFSTWKRAVRDTREVRLGPVRRVPEKDRGAMYGIVAVPAKRVR